MGKKHGGMSRSDWDDRVLCDDEACIGTIGSNGRCRVCGRPGGKQPVVSSVIVDDERLGAKAEKASTAGVKDDLLDSNGRQAVDTGGGADRPPDSDWEARTLCRDESCIGTIGTNGRCRVCGLAYDESKR